MLEKGKIGARQLTILAIFLTIGDSILALPATTAIQGKQDAWLSGVIGLAIGIPIVYLIAVVGKLYPGMTVFMSSRKILGKWLGLVASLLFAVHLFLNASVFLREIGDFVTSHMMPETPIQSILLLFLCIIVMGTKLGLEVIARTGELLFPFLFFCFCFLLLRWLQKQIWSMCSLFSRMVFARCFAERWLRSRILMWSLLFCSWSFRMLARLSVLEGACCLAVY